MKKFLMFMSILSICGFSQVLIVKKGVFEKEELKILTGEIELKEGNCFGINYSSPDPIIYKLKNNRNFLVEERNVTNTYFPLFYCFKNTDLNSSGRWTLSLKNKYQEEYSFAYFDLKKSKEENLSKEENITEKSEILDFKRIETPILENSGKIISPEMLKSI